MSFFAKDTVFDGALGTRLLERGLPPGARSETANVTMPSVVERIHAEYAAAGADYITANTFGANPFSQPDYAALIAAGIRLAKSAGKPVGLDVGPTGIAPRAADFDRLYQAFVKVVEAGAAAGADFVLIETMTSLVELRAALLAAKEHSKLPVAALMSFERSGRTAFGVRADSFALSAMALGADAVGANCSTGPDELADAAAAMLRAVGLPVIVMPNAGMPTISGGKAVYDMDEKRFFSGIEKLKALGVDVVGGCCGTTPAYIATLTGLRAGPRPAPDKGALCSASTYFLPPSGQTAVVGERINPTGKPKLRQALREGRIDVVDPLCREQQSDGACLLDVNVGVPGEERALIDAVLPRVADLSPLPLVLDSADPAVLERALRLYPGRALVNSVNGSRQSLETVLPVVSRYGAAVVGLTLDEDGIPATAEGRMRIARRIVEAAAQNGIEPCDVYIDALTMAEGSTPGGAAVTLETIARVGEMGANTILGVSNVSFGLPQREDVNAAFLELASARGLTLAIVNPKYVGLTGSRAAFDMLTGAIPVEAYIASASKVPARPPQPDDRPLSLKEAVLCGDAAAAEKAALTLLRTHAPLAVAEAHIIPALDALGDDYAAGKTFLPGLIASAEAAEAAFRHVRARLAGKAGLGRFVIATVKGDIHDIGKNVTAAVCMSYGVDVVDLGKDVAVERVLEAVRENHPCVLGLSALMTTTAANMAETARAVRKEFPDITILSGGAAVTPEFCRSIGTIYCATATDTARRLEAYFKKRA